MNLHIYEALRAIVSVESVSSLSNSCGTLVRYSVNTNCTKVYSNATL